MARTYSRNHARLVGTDPVRQRTPRLASRKAVESARPLLFFPGRLSEAMDDAGADAARLSDATGVSRKRISALRGGSHLPRCGDLAAIAVALGVSSDWLLGIDERKRR